MKQSYNSPAKTHSSRTLLNRKQEEQVQSKLGNPVTNSSK